MGTLPEAIKDGDVTRVEILLKNGADSNKTSRIGLSGLHLAAIHDQVQIMQLLIQYGGDYNQRTSWGSSPLHFAAFHGHLDVVTSLLNCKAVVDLIDDNLDTPLHLAFSQGHTDVIRKLLHQGADFHLKNKTGNTAPDEGSNYEMPSDIADFLTSSVGQEKIFAMSSESEKFPLVHECSKALLNVNEFVPDFEVPTNESYSSIINEFSLPAKKSNIAMLSDDLNCGEMLASYSGTKSIEKAQMFSFIRGSPSLSSSSLKNFTLDGINKDLCGAGQSFMNSNCSIVNILKLDHEKITGSSIDSSVYPETYQLYKQLNPDGNIGISPNLSVSGSLCEYGFNSSPGTNRLDSNHSSVLSSYSGCIGLNKLSQGISKVFISSTGKLDAVIANLAPILDDVPLSTMTLVLSNIARNMELPWPAELDDNTVEYKTNWVFGEDYVLVSNTPINVRNVQDREGSCSLIFKVLHQKYGPMVLKMMVNLLNESDHDTGQSETIFLKKQFSAEHSIPASLNRHPNIVHMLHCYNGSTTPFKRFLPLLVPSGLDVDVDMASRTSFFAMPEYPFSLKNYVNKFVEQKVKLGLTNKSRMNSELRLIALLLLQCLFALDHLKSHNVVHRDIKLDNIMLRHSGQVILIDFGMAVNIYNQDGSPMVATSKDDIVAGNPSAWTPEISQHHNSFSHPVSFSEVYRKSDIFTLGRTFSSVLEVFGFVKRSVSGKMEVPDDFVNEPYLRHCNDLLDRMTYDSPDERISVEDAIVTLGKQLFFSDCKNHRDLLVNYMKISLQEVQSFASITDIEHLTAVATLSVAVSKQFISTVNVSKLISSCVFPS